MSQATRKHRRLRPYAWLGASAVTLGLGASMVSGAAVAAADAGADASSGTVTSSGPAGSPGSNAASSNTAPAVPRRAPRNARSAAAAGPGNAVATRTNRAETAAVTAPAVNDDLAVVAPDPSSEAATAPAAETPAFAVPAAAAARPRARAARHAAAAKPAYAEGTLAQATVAAPTAAVEPVDPPFIPNNIVPGAHVTLALNEIGAAQGTLNQVTWGAGNYAAGLAAIVPQLFLAEAQLSLTLWQNNMPAAQQLVAATAGIPIIQQLTEINLFVTATLPTFAQFGLGGAALFLPLVSLLGAATAPTEEFISKARSDGTVYAVIPVQMKYGTEQVITATIGGARTSLLVDTGSSGLVTTLDQAGDAVPTDQTGTITYSGASDTPFNYRVYKTTVDFGGGAVATDTYIDVIEDTPAQEAAFKDFVASTGSNGILGTGAAAVGPGPGFIPTSQLPGELSDGYLVNQNVFLGLFGVMIFGPNPFPARVSVPGSPYGQLQVQIGSNAPQPVIDAIIDSGGVYGTLPESLFPGSTVFSQVPAGTKISVYTGDGQTLLYSYTTNSANGPTIVPDDPLGMDVNTGNIPFGQQLIYTDYSSTWYPNGATVFDIA